MEIQNIKITQKELDILISSHQVQLNYSIDSVCYSCGDYHPIKIKLIKDNN